MSVYYVCHEQKQRTEITPSLEGFFREARDNIAPKNQNINGQSTWKQMECLLILIKAWFLK